MLQRLWGDHFFDPEQKKWTTSYTSISGKRLSRGFCQLVLDPLQKLFHSVMTGNDTNVQKILQALKIKLTSEQSLQTGKALLKTILNKWLPLNTAVLETLVNAVPSPPQAQKYRTDILYAGPQDDKTAESIRKCDVKGPLMIYVCSIIPSAARTNLYALGRVFSGTIQPGQTVHILVPERQPNSFATDREIFHKQVGMTMLHAARAIVAVDRISAGNICLLSGIDQFITRSATISSEEVFCPFVMPLARRAQPPIRCAVEPDIPAHLPKLMEGLKYLSKWDPQVQVCMEETGELFIAADNELQIEISIREIEDRFMDQGRIKVLEPYVTYKETVIAASPVCMSKSPNRFNQLHVTALPLEDGLPEAIERIQKRDRLVSDLGWKEEYVKKIWCFGSDDNIANMVVNTCHEGHTEIKDAVTAAFAWITREGVMAQEGVRGVQFNIVDALLHSDAVHRGSGQIIPTARRVFYGSMLSAQPRLMEPMMAVEIQCSQDTLGGVYSVLNCRRGILVEEIPRSGSSIVTVKGYLPAENSFGFMADVRANTYGEAITQMVFDHYIVVPEDPSTPGTRANEILTRIQKRKGLPQNWPDLTKYLDQL